MAGKVFISCGQRGQQEKGIAEKVRDLLESLEFNTYLAFKIMSLNDIMTIVKELRSSDYYLFIDFLRDPKDPQDLPCSLFTHQEMAIAHHLGFKENIIALQQKGAKLEGFLKYVLSNPEQFENETDLIEKIERLIRERKWSNIFSRNLVIQGIELSGPWNYKDHTGESVDWVCQLKVENGRPDVAAIGTVCILDRVKKLDGSHVDHGDRSYLKWARQAGYERTILPKDHGYIDLFAIRGDRPGLFLHSLRDTPREPILVENGTYRLSFKLFSREFPLLEFTIKLDILWAQDSSGKWGNIVIASLDNGFLTNPPGESEAGTQASISIRAMTIDPSRQTTTISGMFNGTSGYKPDE